ncbi:unnamed protein product [Ostreobium quekettii]|uniref:Uncharacterized protein n=1 Tax=Ostreobium quekettii TaxID=121088 RepID=A0A8S1JFA3_9CHLO|nr:unnamed protein product [Ostreobium quekettii]|eukprot:evm.model.scf_152.6 EVM.evm.TU.scf_152.6   scf_152:96202-102831(-)
MCALLTKIRVLADGAQDADARLMAGLGLAEGLLGVDAAAIGADGGNGGDRRSLGAERSESMPDSVRIARMAAVGARGRARDRRREGPGRLEGMSEAVRSACVRELGAALQDAMWGIGGSGERYGEGSGRGGAVASSSAGGAVEMSRRFCPREGAAMQGRDSGRGLAEADSSAGGEIDAPKELCQGKGLDAGGGGPKRGVGWEREAMEAKSSAGDSDRMSRKFRSGKAMGEMPRELCLREAGMDHRWWRLLAIVVGSGRGVAVDAGLAVAAAGALARMRGADCEEGRRLADGILMALRAVREAGGMAALGGTEEWAEMLGAGLAVLSCGFVTGDDGGGEEILQLGKFLFVEARGRLEALERQGPVLAAVGGSLCFDALRVASRRGVRSGVGRAIREFLAGVIFHPAHLGAWARVCLEDFGAGSGEGGPRAASHKRVRGFFQQMADAAAGELAEGGDGELQACVAGSLGWMVESFTAAWGRVNPEGRGVEDGKGRHGSWASVPFCVFAKLAAVTVPVLVNAASPSADTGLMDPHGCRDRARKRKREEGKGKGGKGMPWWVASTALAEGLQAVKATGAYRPTDDPGGRQKRFLEGLAGAVLSHCSPACQAPTPLSKRPRGQDVMPEGAPAGGTGDAMEWCAAVKAIQALLELEYRVVQPHLETVWLVLFGAAGVTGQEGAVPAVVCTTAAKLVEVYSHIRQLDVLLDAAATCVRCHRQATSIKVLCSEEFVSAIAASVRSLPVGQTSRFVHWVGREVRELSEALPDPVLLALGEVLDCVLQNLMVDLTNAMPVALAAKAVLMTKPVKHHLVHMVGRRHAFGVRPVLATVLLRLYSSTLQLHAACVRQCPAVQPLSGQGLEIDNTDRLRCSYGPDQESYTGGEYFEAAEIGGPPGKRCPTLLSVAQDLFTGLESGVFQVFVDNPDWGSVLASTLAGCILHRMAVLKMRALRLGCACPEANKEGAGDALVRGIDGSARGTMGPGTSEEASDSGVSSNGNALEEGTRWLRCSDGQDAADSNGSDQGDGVDTVEGVQEESWLGGLDSSRLPGAPSVAGRDSEASSSSSFLSEGSSDGLSSIDMAEAQSPFSEVHDACEEWNQNACDACLDELGQLGSLLLRISPRDLDLSALAAVAEPRGPVFFGLSAGQSMCWTFMHMCETFEAWAEHCPPEGKVRFVQHVMAISSEGEAGDCWPGSMLGFMRRAADHLWANPSVYEVAGYDLVCHVAFVRRALEHLSRLPAQIQQGCGGDLSPLPGAFCGQGPRSPGLMYSDSVGKCSPLDLSVQLSCQVSKLLGLRQSVVAAEEAGQGHPIFLGRGLAAEHPAASELRSLQRLTRLMCMFPSGHFNTCSKEAIHAALFLGKMLVECLLNAMGASGDDARAGVHASVVARIAQCLVALFRWLAYLTAGGPDAAGAFYDTAGEAGMLWLHLASDVVIALSSLLRVYGHNCDLEVGSNAVEGVSGVVSNVAAGWLMAGARDESELSGSQGGCLIGVQDRGRGKQAGGGVVQSVLDIIAAQGWGDTMSEQDVAGCFLARASPHVANACMLRSCRAWLVDSVAMALCRAVLHATEVAGRESGSGMSCLSGSVTPVGRLSTDGQVRAVLDSIQSSMGELETTIVDHFMSLTELLKCISGFKAGGAAKQSSGVGTNDPGLAATHQALLHAAACLCSAISQRVGVHALQPRQPGISQHSLPPCLALLGPILSQVSSLLFGGHSPLQLDCRTATDRLGGLWTPGALAKVIDLLHCAGSVFPLIEPPLPVDTFVDLACIHLLLFAGLPLDPSGPDTLRQTSNSLGGPAAIAIDPPHGPQLRQSIADSLQRLVSGGVPAEHVTSLVEALEQGMQHPGEPALAYACLQGLLLCLEIRTGPKIKHHIAARAGGLAQSVLSCMTRMAITTTAFDPGGDERDKTFLAAALCAGLRCLESMIATRSFALPAPVVAQAARLGHVLLQHSGDAGTRALAGTMRWDGRRGTCLAAASANVLTAILRHRPGHLPRTGHLVLQSFRTILGFLCAWEAVWSDSHKACQPADRGTTSIHQVPSSLRPLHQVPTSTSLQNCNMPWTRQSWDSSEMQGIGGEPSTARDRSEVRATSEARAILSRCAIALSVVVEEVARGRRGTQCVTVLAEYLTAVAEAGAPEKRSGGGGGAAGPWGCSGEAAGAKRGGVLWEMRGAALEVYKVLGREELQHLHVGLRQEGARRALAELRREYRRGRR